MLKTAYELGAALAREHVKKASLLTAKNLGLAGLGMGGAYGLLGTPGDPYAEYNRPGLLRGAALWGARGLGSGIGIQAARGMGANPIIGGALGLLVGNSLGRGVVGPERPLVTGPMSALGR